MLDEVVFRFENNILTARIIGEIDHHSSRRMRGEIDEKMYETRPAMLVMDFRRVKFMDSSGIGLILGRCDTAVALMINVRIINVSKPIMRLIRLSGIDRVSNLTVEPKLENEHPRPVDLDGKYDGDYGFNEELYII